MDALFEVHHEIAAKKSNGFRIAATGGTSKNQAENEPLRYVMDLLAVVDIANNQIVMIFASGSEVPMSDNADDIVMKRRSLSKSPEREIAIGAIKR